MQVSDGLPLQARWEPEQQVTEVKGPQGQVCNGLIVRTVPTMVASWRHQEVQAKRSSLGVTHTKLLRTKKGRGAPLSLLEPDSL